MHFTDTNFAPNYVFEKNQEACKIHNIYTIMVYKMRIYNPLLASKKRQHTLISCY